MRYNQFRPASQVNHLRALQPVLLMTCSLLAQLARHESCAWLQIMQAVPGCKACSVGIACLHCRVEFHCACGMGQAAQTCKGCWPKLRHGTPLQGCHLGGTQVRHYPIYHRAATGIYNEETDVFSARMDEPFEKEVSGSHALASSIALSPC